MRFSLALALLLGLFLTGCAIAPAGVSRVSDHDERKLHALLTAALTTPDATASARALGHFVEKWYKETKGTQATLVLQPDTDEKGPTYRVRFDPPAAGVYPLNYFDDISPASDFVVKKLPHHVHEGVGTPMLATRKNRGQQAIERFYPPEAITRPLTAVVQPGKVRGRTQDVRLQLLCSLMNDTVVINGVRKDLAADFSVPWAAALAKEGTLNQLRVTDMLTSSPQRKPQLYMMEPYDPRKEPIIMIHGLLSSPLAWARTCNELWADDAIRRRYQIWHFLYNTSAPALYSSRILRLQLAELRHLLDPSGKDPAMRRTTLLTHSMGGLVGKMLAMQPGDAFWKAAFTVPKKSLKLDAKDLMALSDAFDWKADPTIHRIIFIATPHRGSAFADNIVGRVGSWMIQPPDDFSSFFGRIAKANPGVFTPEYAALKKIDGVSSMGPHQPTLRILSEMPFAHKVTTHSIIGKNDFIVPYSSSHLDSAASELLVPTRHRAFRHPAAIAEIQRILKLPVQ